MRKQLICLFTAVFTLLSLTSVQADDKIVLKYGELNPDGNIMADTAREFANLVAEKSGGRIEIEVYPASQLGDERTQLQAVQMGAIDLFRPNTNSMGDFGAKKMNLFALPYVFRNRDHLWKVLKSPIGDELLQDVADSGTKMVALCYVEEGSRNFFFRENPVTKVADLKGLKIRVPQTQILMDTVNAFGASATPISYSELYSALQTGVVDGAENPPTGYLFNNFYEVAPYYTLDGHTYSPSLIVISEMKWKKLSEEDRKVLLEAARAVQEVNRKMAEERDVEALTALKEKGVTISDVDDIAEWQEAAKPLHEQYGSDYQELLDAIANVK
jgi:tripartite ATP-independent transporter DctP family solute receptor